MTNPSEDGEQTGAIAFKQATAAYRAIVNQATRHEGGCAVLSADHSPPDNLLAVFKELGSNKMRFGVKEEWRDDIREFRGWIKGWCTVASN